jgi:hypothetical protein
MFVFVDDIHDLILLYLCCLAAGHWQQFSIRKSLSADGAD